MRFYIDSQVVLSRFTNFTRARAGRKKRAKVAVRYGRYEQVTLFFKKCLRDFQFVLKTKNAESHLVRQKTN